MVYRYIAEHSAGKKTVLATVLTGECAGAHCLYEAGRPVYTDAEYPAGIDEAVLSAPDSAVVLSRGIRIFAEHIGSRRKMETCGGGHVASSLLKIASMTGFETYVLEDRQAFAEKASENRADHVLTGPFAESLGKIPDDPGIFYVVMTRGHRYDMECLSVILKRKPVYTGMMCSRSRGEDAKKLLLTQGLDRETVDSLHTPIGLEIGAETPEEIAISVMAEIIKTARAEGVGGIPKEILRALTEEGEHVLALIVSREGSAPRSVGTRMVVRPDGSFTGTIGGGLLEAVVLRRAKEMAAIGGEPALIRFDLSGNENLGEDWSACGGVVEVFFSRREPGSFS